MQGLPPWQMALGALCGFSVGVSKSGLPGAGIFVVPMMVLLVGDARLAAGWMLPMICVGDWFAVYHWRRHAHPRELLGLAPWVVAGMIAGAAALALPERNLRWGVGLIILVMLGLHMARRWRPEVVVFPAHPSPYGVVTGFASTVANAAGPVMSLYLLSKQLPKERFLGTTAWFFFFLNLTKVPIYAAYGLFSRQSLGFAALMIAPIAAGALAGRWIAHHIDQPAFEMIIVGITFVATLALFR